MQNVTTAKSHRLVGYIALLLSGPLFMTLTDPSRLPLVFIVVPFIWLFALLYVSINFVVGWRLPDAPRKRRIIISGVGAALPVLLLVFESIHQLTVKDFLLALSLVAFVSFYMARADFIH